MSAGLHSFYMPKVVLTNKLCLDWDLFEALVCAFQSILRVCQHLRPADACRAFGNPSYHVQALFAEHQGVRYAQTEIDSLSARDNGVTASVTCQDEACSRLSIKAGITFLNCEMRASKCQSACSPVILLHQC